MGDGRATSERGLQVRAAGELRARVGEQAPAVFITLVSVLIGLVLSDLVMEARARMHLWPLDFLALRTWGQLAANGAAALSVWAILAHLGLARRRTPNLLETASAFGPPLLLLATNTFVGRAEFWPWLYGATSYLLTAAVTDSLNVWLTMDQPGGRRFAPLLDPRRHTLVVYLSIPIYLAGAITGQRGWLPPAGELALAFAPLPATLLVVWLFFRDWRAAIDDDGGPGSPPA
jgi:hypothetical protein